MESECKQLPDTSAAHAPTAQASVDQNTTPKSSAAQSSAPKSSETKSPVAQTVAASSSTTKLPADQSTTAQTPATKSTVARSSTTKAPAVKSSAAKSHTDKTPVAKSSAAQTSTSKSPAAQPSTAKTLGDKSSAAQTSTAKTPAAQTSSAKSSAAQTSSAKSAKTPRKATRDTDDAAQTALPPTRKIYVSGYPRYTRQHDLLEVFTKFGSVQVESFGSRTSTLKFTKEEEAKAAMNMSKQLHIYGHFLSVRPNTKPENVKAEPSSPRREFPMSKQKGVIIEPKKIDMAGDFHSQLDNILAAVRLTQENVKALSQLYTDLEIVLQQQWPGCKAIPFGSITTGLGIKTSDADCFMSLPAQFRQPNASSSTHVNKAKRVLQQYPNRFAEILSIPRANTPIVKFFHIPTKTNCDVTFKTPLGAQNSRLIAFLLHADPRLLPMAVIIKYWAKVHLLSGTGKLTNYALTMMIIFYLQQPPMSIVPPVEWLQRDPAYAFIVDYWNTGFMNNSANLPPSSNTSSISELLGGFFEFYAMFNFEEMCICPYLGMAVKKELFKDPASMPNEFDRYKKNVLNNYTLPLKYQSPICVQDPFEQSHNVACTITTKLALDIKTFFKFAANAYEKEKLNGCQEFLKIILLQRPKLIRGRTHPEYRVTLFPRIVNTIISFDWKKVVRDLVFEIFENMLKIKIGKVEEKVNLDTKKEKEKYMGLLTKPIWKRKSFSKLYSIFNMPFEEKQGKITEEIINVEKQNLNIQFQLTLTYCQDPKSAVVSIKLGTGDIDQFREFGKFFISVMQNWFTELLKPFSMPNCKDTAAKIAETMLDNNENSYSTDSDDDDEIVLIPRTEIKDKPETNTVIDTLDKNIEQTVSESPSKKSEENSINDESLTEKVEFLVEKTETLTVGEDRINNALNNNSKPASAATNDVTIACSTK